MEMIIHTCSLDGRILESSQNWLQTSVTENLTSLNW